MSLRDLKDARTIVSIASVVATRKNLTPSQIALAWLLARSPVVLPIPGTSSVANVEENVVAGRVGLTEDDINAVNQIPPFEC